MPPIASEMLLVSAVLVLISAHTVFWGIPIHLLALLKLLENDAGRKQSLTLLIMALVQRWINGVLWILRRFYSIEWDIRGGTGLRPDDSCVLISNHQSWTDLPVLLHVFTGRIPFFRIFAKQEILWLPIIGTSLLSLDYPIMKRYPKRVLQAQPDKRGRDLETTRRMCRRYRTVPVAILIFSEGTRFRKKKQRQQRSPYRHLLKPKIGGMAFAVNAMEGRIRKLLDVTIVYTPSGGDFLTFLRGRLERVTVDVQERSIPEALLTGDYLNDPIYRTAFTTWVEELWMEKDRRIQCISREADRGGSQRPIETAGQASTIAASISVHEDPTAGQRRAGQKPSDET